MLNFSSSLFGKLTQSALTAAYSRYFSTRKAKSFGTSASPRTYSATRDSLSLAIAAALLLMFIFNRPFYSITLDQNVNGSFSGKGLRNSPFCTHPTPSSHCLGRGLDSPSPDLPGTCAELQQGRLGRLPCWPRRRACSLRTPWASRLPGLLDLEAAARERELHRAQSYFFHRSHRRSYFFHRSHRRSSF